MSLVWSAAGSHGGIQFGLELVGLVTGHLRGLVLLDLVHWDVVVPLGDGGIVTDAGRPKCATSLLLLAHAFAPAEPPQEAGDDGHGSQGSNDDASNCASRKTRRFVQ